MGFFDFLFKKDNGANDVNDVPESSSRIVFFKLFINNCSAVGDVYEGTIKDGSAVVEHLNVRTHWAGNEQKEDRQVIARVKGGEELVNSLEAILKKSNVYKWDGFEGKNPPGICDGSSMGFEAKLSDGGSIRAYGSNNFPKGYRDLCDLLYDLVNKTVLSETSFTLHDCTLNVPKNWLGIVSVTYAAYGACFMMDKEGKETAFLRLDYSADGYGDDKNDVRAGKVIKDGEESYISFHFFDNNFYGNITDKQKEILDGITSGDCLAKLTDSIRALNGAQFIKEDGKTLYYSDARKAFSDARSLWLSLNLGGEYGSGCKTFTQDDKKYVSFMMQNKYPKQKSVEAFKAFMCELFDEEFVEIIVDKKVAEGNLVIHDNEVFVDYKKIDDDSRYGGYGVDGEINQTDADHAVIRVSVRKATPEDEKYRYSATETIEFEMVRNAKGSFVFKTFPYWDK